MFHHPCWIISCQTGFVPLALPPSPRPPLRTPSSHQTVYVFTGTLEHVPTLDRWFRRHLCLLPLSLQTNQVLHIRIITDLLNLTWDEIGPLQRDIKRNKRPTGHCRIPVDFRNSHYVNLIPIWTVSGGINNVDAWISDNLVSAHVGDGGCFILGYILYIVRGKITQYWMSTVKRQNGFNHRRDTARNTDL